MTDIELVGDGISAPRRTDDPGSRRRGAEYGRGGRHGPDSGPARSGSTSIATSHWFSTPSRRGAWLAGLGTLGARELHFFIAEEGITAAAYVVISVVGREWTIEECGDRDGSGARVGALLQALIAREPIERRPRSGAGLPHVFVHPRFESSRQHPRQRR